MIINLSSEVEAGVDGNCHNRMSVKKSALADLQFLINPYPGKPFIHLQFVGSMKTLTINFSVFPHLNMKYQDQLSIKFLLIRLWKSSFVGKDSLEASK